MIDAGGPHFGRDECFFSHRPLIAVQAKISARAQSFFLAVVIVLRLPLHARCVIPVGKDSRLTVTVDRQIRMKPLALPFGVLILADNLIVKIPKQLALILETGIGADKPNGVFPRRNRGLTLPISGLMIPTHHPKAHHTRKPWFEPAAP